MRVYKNSLSQVILLGLEKSIDAYVRIEDYLYHSGAYLYGSRPLKKAALSAAIKRLREGGLVEKKIDQRKIILKLTELGREYLEDDSQQFRWDGKWRIVIFDIPENQRVVRNLFRRRLKNWGFRIWQQSVWITKRDVTKKLNMLIKDLKLEDWVAIIESQSPALDNIL